MAANRRRLVTSTSSWRYFGSSGSERRTYPWGSDRLGKSWEALTLLFHRSIFLSQEHLPSSEQYSILSLMYADVGLVVLSERLFQEAPFLRSQVIGEVRTALLKKPHE